MTEQVVPIRLRVDETFVCPCGSQWFSLHYRMSVEGKALERSAVANCDECHRKHRVNPKVWG